MLYEKKGFWASFMSITTPQPHPDYLRLIEKSEQNQTFQSDLCMAALDLNMALLGYQRSVEKKASFQETKKTSK